MIRSVWWIARNAQAAQAAIKGDQQEKMTRGPLKMGLRVPAD
jgi:hypothetical protein